MRGKACSAEFMRRLERMVEAHKGKHKDLVKFITHQTCLKQTQTTQLLRSIELEKSLLPEISEKPHPTILIESLPAPDPKALVLKAIEKEWTAQQVREEVTRLKAIRENNNESIPPPTGKFLTIVVDPPWAYGNVSGRQRPDYAERMMTTEQVIEFGREKISEWIPDDWGHLYLWATAPYVGSVNIILEAWGYTPKVWLVWVKDRFGMGNYYRHQHELCIFAVKGKQRLKRKNASSVFYAPITKHSEKPDAFYDLVESCSFEPYLDVFARKARAGWSVFGDEVNESYQLRMPPTAHRKQSAHLCLPCQVREAE